MSDNATASLSALFETRDAAERAIEHLVQHHGINRADIFAEPVSSQNSAGTRRSGGDANKEDRPSDPALTGEIRVSADVPADRVSDVRDVFNELGGREIRGR